MDGCGGGEVLLLYRSDKELCAEVVGGGGSRECCLGLEIRRRDGDWYYGSLRVRSERCTATHVDREYSCLLLKRYNVGSRTVFLPLKTGTCMCREGLRSCTFNNQSISEDWRNILQSLNNSRCLQGLIWLGEGDYGRMEEALRHCVGEAVLVRGPPEGIRGIRDFLGQADCIVVEKPGGGEFVAWPPAVQRSSGANIKR